MCTLQRTDRGAREAGATVPHPYPAPPAASTVAPTEGMYESPSPAPSPLSPESLSAQAYRLSHLPCSLPLAASRGLCSGRGLWNPGLWGLTAERGWEGVSSTKDGGRGHPPLPQDVAPRGDPTAPAAALGPPPQCQPPRPRPSPPPLRRCLCGSVCLTEPPRPALLLQRRLHLCMLHSYKLCNVLDIGRCM